MSTKKSPATKSPATKAPAKKAAAQVPAKKAPAKTATPVPAAKAPAKTAPAKTAPAKTATPVPAAKAPAKKAPAKKPASPFDAKFLASQRELLLSERATYQASSEALLAEARSLTENLEPGDVQFDEESGEGDSLAVERERDLTLSAQAAAAVEEIDRALLRLDAGTYGICRVSGTPIPRERLKAIAWATERVEHKVGGFTRR